MFVSPNRTSVVVSLLALAALPFAPAAAKDYGVGSPASEAEVEAWDIDIRPDGKGLPAGSGTPAEGEEIYVEKCASCHGDFAEGAGRYPPLMGGFDTLTTEDPIKTIGSYWPYASTVWDYIHRAMPFGNAQSLTADETYAITAYLLQMNQVIEYGQEVNQDNLASFEMPNADGFHRKDRPEFPKTEPCMNDCRDEVEVIGRASDLGVTPKEETSSAGDQEASTQDAGANGSSESGTQQIAGDPEAGKSAFQQCQACHTLKEGGGHRVGPNLHGVFGREAGTADGFGRYSPAMKEAELVWNADTLGKYLAAPQEFMPGTQMPFAGVKDEETLRDLLAYLKEAS